MLTAPGRGVQTTDNFKIPRRGRLLGLDPRIPGVLARGGYEVGYGVGSATRGGASERDADPNGTQMLYG